MAYYITNCSNSLICLLILNMLFQWNKGHETRDADNSEGTRSSGNDCKWLTQSHIHYRKEWVNVNTDSKQVSETTVMYNHTHSCSWLILSKISTD